jgi:hypothetical protein
MRTAPGAARTTAREAMHTEIAADRDALRDIRENRGYGGNGITQDTEENEGTKETEETVSHRGTE